MIPCEPDIESVERAVVERREPPPRGAGARLARPTSVPGYDALAAALSLGLELEVEETGEFSVESDVPGVPLDRTNLCVRAFEALRPADGLAFRIRSEIPPSAGPGVQRRGDRGRACAPPTTCTSWTRRSSSSPRELEGHPDNVAAALLGGFVVCAGRRAGAVRPAARAWRACVAIPPDPVPTAAGAGGAARARCRMADAVHNVAHASLLVLGLASDDFSLIGRGLSDRLHQDRRAPSVSRARWSWCGRAPELGAVGATISGAGPAVLFWCHWQQTGNLLAALKREAPDCEVQRVMFAPGGADVREIE